MTLRDCLNRRTRPANLWVAFGSEFLCASSMSLLTGDLRDLLIIAAFFGAIVPVIVVASRVRCPQCGEDIGYMDTSRMRKHQQWIEGAGLDWRRRCGLHLDVEIPLDPVGLD